MKNLRSDPESRVAYGDRVHISHKHDRYHVCIYYHHHITIISLLYYIHAQIEMYKYHSYNIMSLSTYLKAHYNDYKVLLPSIQYYVRLQSSKLYSKMESLQEISNDYLFVCIFFFVYIYITIISPSYHYYIRQNNHIQ